MLLGSRIASRGAIGRSSSLSSVKCRGVVSGKRTNRPNHISNTRTAASEIELHETVQKDETLSSCSLGAADFAKSSPTGEEDNHRDKNDSAGESQTTPEASIPVSVCASDNVALDNTPTSPVKNEEAAIKPERSPSTPTEAVEHEKSDVSMSTVPSSTAQSDETPTSPVRTEETSHIPNRSPSTPIEGVKPSGLLAARKSMFEHEASDVPDWAKRSGSRSNTSSPGPGSRPSVRRCTEETQHDSGSQSYQWT